MNVFKTAIILAGITQLSIAASSLLIPRLLEWRQETARLRPLTRQVFWTYACYILVAHIAFGILAIAAPSALLDGSVLARAVCAFIATWWLSRVVLQFAVFDRSIAATRPLFRLGEVAYVSSFVYLVLVYTTAAVMQ